MASTKGTATILAQYFGYTDVKAFNAELKALTPKEKAELVALVTATQTDPCPLTPIK